MKKPNRSDKYQHLLLEIPVSYETLSAFHDESFYSEELLDLKDQLFKAYWDLLNRIATPNQLQVAKLLSQGHTQVEAAKILNVNQSSIVKTILGNADYSDPKGKKFYGGIAKKARKAAQSDPTIINILNKIMELQ